MLMSVLLVAGCAMIIAAFYFKRPLVWLVAAGIWIAQGVQSLASSLVVWDVYYFLFWLGVALTIVCALMALQTRGMEKEEERGEEKDDIGKYENEAGEYGEKQERFNKATGGKRRRR